MLKGVINILKRIMPKELPKPLGRWGIEECNIKLNNKVDLSNEDHCGPCGQYALTKIDFIPIQKNNDKIEKRI